MSATANGSDMSLDVFRKGLEIATEYDSFICLGGGEPTLHPQFELMLVEAMAAAADTGNPVFIVTNGSIKRRALLIAQLTKAKVIDGYLSQDQYHDPIDLDVVDAFTKIDAIRDVTKGGTQEPLPAGRGYVLLDEPADRESWMCACTEWVVRTNGSITQCGCDDSPEIGSVDTGISIAACPGECWWSPEFTRAEEEACEEVVE
jgi:hypothetical protein